MVITLAHLLERLERSPVAVDPAQYRSVVTHLVQEFESVKPGETLECGARFLPRGRGAV